MSDNGRGAKILLPIKRLYGELLVDQFTALLKDEVASLSLVPIASPKRFDKNTPRI